MKVYVVIYLGYFDEAKLLGVYYKIEDAEEAKRICDYYCSIIEYEIK